MLLAQEQLGSLTFLRWWEERYPAGSPQEALCMVELVLDRVAMPKELLGKTQQTQDLLARISDLLAPDHTFWQEFSQTVALAFPDNSLAESGDLQRRLHQFRYVISAHQAQWIRHRYKKEGLTDFQALAIFLKGKRRRIWKLPFSHYSLNDSARLHNKLALGEADLCYPDKQKGANLKVLLGFHTEFILSSQGDFLNEIDPEGASINGIVNGASFNYGNRKADSHHRLDIAPIKTHDPAFRKKVIANQGRPFRAPLYQEKAEVNLTDWAKSYFNPQGLYSRAGLSNVAAVNQLAKQLLAEIRKVKRKK